MSDSQQPAAIVTRELTKHYHETVALDSVSLTVPEGSIYGFLGPNGAGKTTTIRLILGFIRATSGEATIGGHDVWSSGVEARRDLGFLVQADALYPEMSGRSQLDFAAALSEAAPVLRNHLLDLLELSQRDLDRRLREYSKGMKQKLALICAAQTNPRLLVLDEPTDGLDPLIQRRFETFLHEFNAGGRTVFMSSHDLAEVERTCKLVAVVRSGRLIADQPVAQMKRRHRRRAEITFSSSVPDSINHLGTLVHVDPVSRQASVDIDGDANRLLRMLAEHDIEELTISAPRLDDVFMTFYEHEEPHVEQGHESRR